MENKTSLASQIPQSAGTQEVRNQGIKSIIHMGILLVRRRIVRASMVALAWSPITWEAEAGWWAPCQFELYSKTLSQR